MTATPPPVMLKAAEVCRMLSIGRRKLWELTNSQKIPCVRYSKRCIRYRLDDVNAWLADRKAGGARVLVDSQAER